MKTETIKRIIVIAIAALWLIITFALFNGTLAAGEPMVVRLFVSVATAAFALLCLAGGGAVVAAAYFLYRMANSPRPGLTIFDTRSSLMSSIFSDQYLNSEGRIAKERLYIAIRCFVGSWICGVLLGIAMYYFYRHAH